MKSVDPQIYDKEYYETICLGSEEYKKSKGKTIHDRWKNLLKGLPVSNKTTILDVGCGRGDITLFLAQKAKLVVGVDYSKDGIALANKIKKNFPQAIQKKTQFKVMNVKKMDFKDNSFDIAICIDVIEHLYKDEVNEALSEIARILKKDGILFIHTGPNKILYDRTYKYYILPMNKFLTKIDQLVKRKKYASLPSDPRTPVEKEQHVNEPTYYYLRSVLKRYGFTGKINIVPGYVKPVTGIRSHFYNAIAVLYPLSKYYPLNIVFGWAFIGMFKNTKKVH
jgi:ubiquinone/menaquinone biosynthesis C-methylase UbiE